MADRMQALRGNVLDIVRALTRAESPLNQGGVPAFTHLLRSLVQDLLDRLLPREPEVPHHRNQSQSDGAARREDHGPFVAVVAFDLEIRLDRLGGAITCGEK